MADYYPGHHVFRGDLIGVKDGVSTGICLQRKDDGSTFFLIYEGPTSIRFYLDEKATKILVTQLQ